MFDIAKDNLDAAERTLGRLKILRKNFTGRMQLPVCSTPYIRSVVKRIRYWRGTVESYTTKPEPRPESKRTSYYPEMNEEKRSTALFSAQICLSKWALKWKVERHQEALDAFRKLRIRPSGMQFNDKSATVHKTEYWTALVTCDAYSKLTDVDTEIPLD